MFGDTARFAGLRGMGRLTKLRDRVRDLLRPEPVVHAPSPLDDERFRTAKHVFMFGVCGRSSTTALMRILNSSHEVCVWGEPGDHIVDDLLRVWTALEQKNANPNFRDRKDILPRAFREQNHSIAHAMAFPELQPAIADLTRALVHMLAPAIDVDRFGFKEITVRGPETLGTLQRMFPCAQFIFLFRDPYTQWPSVKKMGWPHVKTLELFLAEYERLANIYMEFGGTFVETASLHDIGRVRDLTRKLDLSRFDEGLIGDGVFAMRDKAPLTDEETAAIGASLAWSCYQAMQARESV
jgi:hypothetical protein